MGNQRPQWLHNHGIDAKRMKVLLVEDNEADVWLFREAFKALRLDHELEVAPDGAEALERLEAGASQSITLPDVILLDINTPKVDGFEVLTSVRSDPRLCVIPVIILSSSRDEGDIRRAHQLGANSYICKTDDFSDLVGDFSRFWLQRAEIPQPELPRY